MEYSTVFGNYDFTFDDVDFLLKRDWAPDIYDIDELLWTIRQDVFEDVLANRSAYPLRVRELLDFYDPNRVCKVRDLTDEEMNAILEGDEEARIRKEKEDYEAYVPPERPRNIIDERNDELRHELLNRNMTTEQRQDLENEFEESNKRLANEKRYWKELQWLSAKLASVRHISL